MSEVQRKIDTGSLVAGVLMIGFGALLLVQQLDIVELHFVLRRYWALILVAIGVPMLFNPKKIWSGLWLVTLGFWLQVAHLRLFGLTYRNSWPLLLIALGAGITIRALIDTTTPKEQPHD